MIKGSSAKFFIMPNNNNDGNLEHLLDQIISEKGANFHGCLSKYITCLSTLNKESIPREILENPDLNKKKLEWYTYMMLGKFGKKENTQNYLNEDLWDLNSNILDPLNLFFTEIFK